MRYTKDGIEDIFNFGTLSDVEVYYNGKELYLYNDGQWDSKFGVNVGVVLFSIMTNRFLFFGITLE